MRSTCAHAARVHYVTYLIALAALLRGVPSQAQSSGAAATAEALFRAGRQASQRGDSHAACAKYRESYRLEPATGTLLNIAICETELGQLSEAWRHLQQVIPVLPADDQRSAIAKRQLRAVELRLPQLTIRLAADAPADTTASIDGIELEAASFGIALPVDPGHHELEVRAPHYEPRRYPLEISERDRPTLEIAPGLAVAPPASASPAAPSNPRPAQLSAALSEPGSPSQPAQAAASPPAPSAPPAQQQTPAGPRLSRTPGETPATPTVGIGTARGAGYVLIGAGGLGLVTALATSALMIDRLAVTRRHCHDDMTCDVTGFAARDTGQAYYVATITSFGVAAACLGAAWYLLASDRDSEAGAARVAVAPGAGSLQVRGQF